MIDNRISVVIILKSKSNPPLLFKGKDLKLIGENDFTSNIKDSTVFESKKQANDFIKFLKSGYKSLLNKKDIYNIDLLECNYLSNKMKEC